MKKGEAIDVLEIGGGSGTNFKSVPFRTKYFRNLLHQKVFPSKLMNQVLEKKGEGSGVGTEPTLCEIFRGEEKGSRSTPSSARATSGWFKVFPAVKETPHIKNP